MKPLETQLEVQKEWEYCVKDVASKQDLVDITANVKNSHSQPRSLNSREHARAAAKLLT